MTSVLGPSQRQPTSAAPRRHHPNRITTPERKPSDGAEWIGNGRRGSSNAPGMPIGHASNASPDAFSDDRHVPVARVGPGGDVAVSVWDTTGLGAFGFGISTRPPPRRACRRARRIESVDRRRRGPPGFAEPRLFRSRERTCLRPRSSPGRRQYAPTGPPWEWQCSGWQSARAVPVRGRAGCWQRAGPAGQQCTARAWEWPWRPGWPGTWARRPRGRCGSWQRGRCGSWQRDGIGGAFASGVPAFLGEHAYDCFAHAFATDHIGGHRHDVPVGWSRCVGLQAARRAARLEAAADHR
jgi:hypothetical protein